MKKAFLMIAAGAVILVGCTKEEQPTADNSAATVDSGKAGQANAAGAPPMGLKNGGQDIQPGGKLGN